MITLQKTTNGWVVFLECYKLNNLAGFFVTIVKIYLLSREKMLHMGHVATVSM